MRIIYLKIKRFFSYQRIAPFETMLGFFLIYAGTFGVIYTISGKAVASITTLGYKTTVILNISYLIAGLGMFFGIGLNKYNIEAFGLATVATSLLVRAILTAWIVGIHSPLIMNIIVLNSIFILSCTVRLINIIKLHRAKEVIIITK
jgi:hypothetical protein